MIFAQSGFGKTNLMKVLLYHMASDSSYGKLIFDLNGEYVFKGQTTYGLGDIDELFIKNNLVVYTDKQFNVDYKDRFQYLGKVLINMHKHLTIGDILSFSAGFSEVMKSFLIYLDEEGVGDFIRKIDTYVDFPENLHKDFPDFFAQAKKGNSDASAQKTIMAIRKRIRHLIDEGKGLHSSKSQMVSDIFDSLKKGKTVVVDLSLKDSHDASIVSTIIVRELFERNKTNYTSHKEDALINTVVCVEEAQNVLSDDFVKSNTNPFVRVAKEGRKFGLGMIAITQRPSAIADEIRTQAENFFSFYMGNSDDIKALVKSNINYDGVISKFLQRETISGNLYMVSANQSFVVPIKVSHFEKMVHNKTYSSSRLKMFSENVTQG